MKQFCLTILMALFYVNALAQFNYGFSNTKISAGTYNDIATTGAAISMSNNENGSSTSPQNIGFNFTFNGIVFTQVMIHADGILKFGTTAPGISTLIAASPLNSYANVFTSTNTAFQNIVMPLFVDLVQGNSTPQFHILTTGIAPNRVTIIQWKNLRDADNPGSTLQHQFNNLEFQVKLHETTNNIEMAYGTWLSATSNAATRGSAIGIKASNTDFISYTKTGTSLTFDKADFEDITTNNGRLVLIEKSVAPIAGTSLLYFARLSNDINVSKIYVDDAVPQTLTIGKNIQALIKNEGTTTATNIPVTITISGANTHTETINIANLAAGASQIISFTPFVVASKGVQNVQISTNPILDERIENNSLQTSQTVSTSLIKLFNNDKISGSGFGFNNATSMIATKIFGTGTRNISQIKALFVTNNILVDVRIYEDNGSGNLPGAVPIFISPSFRTNTQNDEIIPITPGVLVTGDYYIVVAQREMANMGLRFFLQHPRLPQKVYNAALDGSIWTESTTPFNAILSAFQQTSFVDVGFEHITSPLCAQTNNETIKATIRNFSNQIHNYANNPVTIVGIVKDELNNTTIAFNFTKNTGSIPAGGRDTVTLLNNYDFTAKGNFIFNAKTICVADTESFNDSLKFSIFKKITFSGVPADSICPNTSVVLSINSPHLRAPLHFTSASDGTFITFTPTVTVKPNATTTYFATGVDYKGCTITDSVIVKVKILGVPEPPNISTLDSVLSFKNDFSVVLTAPTLAGHTITWTSSSAGGVVSNANSTYTVSAITAAGLNENHHAFYTRTADGCSSVLSNKITTSFATGLLISDNLTTVCDTSFYDNGGVNGNHTNTNFTKTYSPTDGTKKLKLTINKFALTQFGNITVFDGSDENAPQIGSITNTTSATNKLEFVASNTAGQLTVRFIAIGSANGFLGGLTCQTPLQFRSIANGIFADKNIWESRAMSNGSFTAATRAPNKGDDSIWVMHNVNINSSIPLDQVVVEPTGNLEVTGTGTDVAMYKTIPDNELTIRGSFKTNPNSFFGRNSTNILLLGSLINNIDMQTDSIKVFGNTSPTVISGNGTISKLIMNSNHALMVNGNVNISRDLSLINGIVKVNAANVITMVAGQGPIITGGNANSYVEGKLRRQEFSTSDSIVFPLGANGLYRRISLLANQNSFDNAVEYEAEMKFGPAPTRTLPSTLAAVNGRYFHKISITNNPLNFTDAQLTIHYDVGDGVADAPNLRMAKDDGGTNWIDIGGSGTLNGTGSITSNSFTSFSDFVLANSTAGINVLPLRLVSFTGIAKQNINVLKWITENEINTVHFIVQKSEDAIGFINIGTVNATRMFNNSYHFNDANYTSAGMQKSNTFYRLKIIDANGSFFYSNIIKLNNNKTNIISIYPNPAQNILVVSSYNVIDALITNSVGQTIKNIKLNAGTLLINVSTWAKGLYYIKTKNETVSFLKQ